MRKELKLTTSMAAALLALPSCSTGDDWNADVVADRDTAVCVDRDGRRVDDDLCDDRRHGGGGVYFARYYLNRGATIPYYGESIRDPRYARAGSFTPRSGTAYAEAPAATRMTRSVAVSRGGLGSSGRSFGGGRS